MSAIVSSSRSTADWEVGGQGRAASNPRPPSSPAVAPGPRRATRLLQPERCVDGAGRPSFDKKLASTGKVERFLRHIDARGPKLDPVSTLPDPIALCCPRRDYFQLNFG